MQPKRNIDLRIYDILVSGTRDQRLFVCFNDPKYFAIYYFNEYFDYPFADYHYDFFEDTLKLTHGIFDEAAWIGFRESAKTSIAKIALCYAICFQLKKYINVDSYDKANAEAILFDVAVTLQTNRKIIEDFGQLYYKKKGIAKGDDDDEGSKIKRLDNFITETEIKVEAHSTQESTRGRLFKNYRPDFYLLDDFENSKTIESQPVMAKIKAHIDEMKAGIANAAAILYLGNYLTESGVVAYVMDALGRNPDRAVVRNIPVMNEKGVIAWPDKYVKTDIEASDENKEIENPRKRKISLEAKRRQLGDTVFEREMMHNPQKAGLYYFDRMKVKEALAKAVEPVKMRGDFKIYAEYNPMHVYGIGADTSEGKGLDSNASVAIDFKRKPNLVVGTYANNSIQPHVFSWELKRQGEYFGEALIGAEMNNTGFATNAELQNIYSNIYQREAKHKITGQALNEYGWRTTLGNKYLIMGEFKTAFEDGDLEIRDVGLLTEMLHFTKTDMNVMKSEEGMTRHFDLLMAACIAWEMRKGVRIPNDNPKKRDPFKSPQKPYEGLV